MRNCHKRWKRERKTEREYCKKQWDEETKKLKDLQLFLHKHPDQASYELERMRSTMATPLVHLSKSLLFNSNGV